MMNTLLLTLSIAFVIVLFAIGLLGAGWLLSGKSKIRAGACGLDPTKKKKKDDSCGTKSSCELCDKHDDK